MATWPSRSLLHVVLLFHEFFEWLLLFVVENAAEEDHKRCLSEVC